MLMQPVWARPTPGMGCEAMCASVGDDEVLAPQSASLDCEGLPPESRDSPELEWELPRVTFAMWLRRWPCLSSSLLFVWVSILVLGQLGTTIWWFWQSKVQLLYAVASFLVVSFVLTRSRLGWCLRHVCLRVLLTQAFQVAAVVLWLVQGSNKHSLTSFPNSRTHVHALMSNILVKSRMCSVSPQRSEPLV